MNIKLFIIKNLKPGNFHILTHLLEFLDTFIQVIIVHEMNNITFRKEHFVLIFVIEKHITQEFELISFFYLIFIYSILPRSKLMIIVLFNFFIISLIYLLLIIFFFLVNELILHHFIFLFLFLLIVKLIIILREVDILKINVFIITIYIKIILIGLILNFRQLRLIWSRF